MSQIFAPAEPALDMRARGGRIALDHFRCGADRPLDQIGVALHVGEVMYGNIGARGRLDFTVIGAPVNEVCRVEALTKPLGREVLLTKAFVKAAKLGGAEPLGAQELKGVDTPLEVFGLPPGM